MVNKNAGYDNKGQYNGYNKNNKDREEKDFYATPPEEVTNILRTLGLSDFELGKILEPCCGAGHMIMPINQYLLDNNFKGTVIGTDIVDRGYHSPYVKYGEQFDFLSDKYPFSSNIDTIIMNPPYSLIEDFTLKALEIANKRVIMLARSQFTESQSRFEAIFKDNPPTHIYQYVDRIACYKNGDFTKKQSSAQSYSWFVWEKSSIGETYFNWIRRSDKL